MKARHRIALTLLFGSVAVSCAPSLSGDDGSRPQPAWVTFLSDPPGARVRVNGAALGGVTPLEHVAVEAGFVEVEFALDGHRGERVQATLEPGAALRIDVGLRPLPAATATKTMAWRSTPTPSATHTAAPAATEVPATPTLLPTAALAVEAAAAAPTAVARLSATVSFDSEPPGAAVFIDGRRLGTTPVEAVELAPGATSIRFALAGHESVELGRTWNAGEVDRVAVVLFPLAAAAADPVVASAELPVPAPDGERYARIAAGRTAIGDARFGEDNPPREFDGAALWVGRTEVTVAAYDACVAAGRCAAAGAGADCNAGIDGRARHPVNCIRAADAQAYAAWLTETSGMPHRLPTCDEWERAARLEGRFPWGDEAPGARCNGCDRRCPFAHFRDEGIDDGARTTAAVGSLPGCRGALGIHDQVGNVAEWCTDARDGFQVRGGSWGQIGVFLDPAFAVRRDGGDRDATVGFRVVVPSVD